MHRISDDPYLPTNRLTLSDHIHDSGLATPRVDHAPDSSMHDRLRRKFSEEVLAELKRSLRKAVPIS